jgi:hypothetical protein
MNSFNNDVFQLISEMVKVFHNKKKSKERNQCGRARASGNEFEEELRHLIEKYTPKDIRIFVDFPLSLEKSSPKLRTKTFYPDIAFIRGKSLIGIVEAKIDLGYLSKDWVSDREKIINQLKFDGKVKKRGSEFSVSKRFMTACVILTARNDKKRLPLFRKDVENTFVLISQEHCHPNNDKIVRRVKKDYLEGIKQDDELHQKEWKRFEQFIQKLGQSK